MKTASGSFAVHLVFSAMLGFILFFKPTFAQGQSAFATQGTVELGGTVSYLSQSFVMNGYTGGTVTTISLSPYVGYFVGDGFEIGLNPLGIQHTSFSGGSFTQLTIFAAPSYNFKTNGIVYPFVEALLGYTSNSSSSGSYSQTETGFSWGGRGGVKLAVTGNCLLNLGLQYLQVTTNPSGATSRTGYNQFSILAGFTVWLK